MAGGTDVRQHAKALGRAIVGEVRRNWRLLCAAAVAAAAVYWAIELSDYQGRYDIPAGYAVRMTCEADPESALWSGGCDRVAADIARTDKPSFLELYRAFVTVHHQQIPSPQTRRQFTDVACDPAFDQQAALRGTRTCSFRCASTSPQPARPRTRKRSCRRSTRATVPAVDRARGPEP